MKKIGLMLMLCVGFLLYIPHQVFAVDKVVDKKQEKKVLTKEDIPKPMLDVILMMAKDLPSDNLMRHSFSRTQPIIMVFIGNKAMSMVYCSSDGWKEILIDKVIYDFWNKNHSTTLTQQLIDGGVIPEAIEIPLSARVEKIK